MNNSNPIFTIMSSDGYYLAFDDFSQVAYSIKNLVDADEIIVQTMPSADMAWRYLEAHNVFRQLYYGYSQSDGFMLYNLPQIDIFPYGVKGCAAPPKHNTIVDYNYSYEILLSDCRYFILSCLLDVSKLVANFKEVGGIKIYRQNSNSACVRHILAYDAAFQVFMGQEVSLLIPPKRNQTTWGAQGIKLEDDHASFSKNLLPNNR